MMRYYVLFSSSFRCESAPNISHETASATSETTYCGRKVADAATFEPDDNDLEPDCITCSKVAQKLKAKKPAHGELAIDAGTEERVVITADTLTPDLIRRAQDRWPEMITSERAANALGLPERHTPGGLPLYPPPTVVHHDRKYIARLVTECGWALDDDSDDDSARAKDNSK